jgi:predicted naringenin-chalcone synthase
VDFASALHPGDRDHLYYRTENSKLRNVLSKDVPEVGARHGQAVVDRLLSNNGLAYDDISHWIVHPGGERVIDAFRDGLGLTDSDLAPSRKILFEYGNMSSASVLFVLKDVLDQRSPTAGEFGVMCSFGAGFSAFAALLEFS